MHAVYPNAVCTMSWMRELKERRDEVVESFEQEGVRQEKAWLLEDDEGYVLVYAIEAEYLDPVAQEALGSHL